MTTVFQLRVANPDRALDSSAWDRIDDALSSGPVYTSLGKAIDAAQKEVDQMLEEEGGEVLNASPIDWDDSEVANVWNTTHPTLDFVARITVVELL